jgi:glucosyl-dolichyl phosphate glucuronosyltransferase
MSEVAVVVCTRNRPLLLRAALASLDAQTLEPSRWELVVVDNGDGSGEAVAHEARVPHVIREREEGLSRSRNAGWRATDAAVIAFLDDDAVAAPDWLARGLELLAIRNATAAGGPILPLYDAPPPAWFRDEYEHRTWGEDERLLSTGETLSGSNLLVRRAALQVAGGFDERLGMRGSRVAVGEETALFEQLWRLPSMTVAYSPALVVHHRVAPEKMTVGYQLRRAAAAGEAWSTRQELSAPAKARRTAADVAAAGGLLARALVRFRLPLRRWAVDELAPVAGRLGSVRGALS